MTEQQQEADRADKFMWKRGDLKIIKLAPGEMPPAAPLLRRIEQGAEGQRERGEGQSR